MAPELWSKVDEGRGRLVYSEDGTPLVFSENMEDGTPLGYDSSVDMCAMYACSSSRMRVLGQRSAAQVHAHACVCVYACVTPS